MESKRKELRSGYTTGACAAAAAKAATLLFLRQEKITPLSPPLARGENRGVGSVEIPFPDGSRVRFGVRSSECGVDNGVLFARASVIKDAGDDPDITHGAEIMAEVRQIADCGLRIADSNRHVEVVIRGGKGVGTVTKPGLAIPVGESAINPVPRRMITDAVHEAVFECGLANPQSAIRNPQLEITISVPAGAELAKKTLNHRLGIIGGISILGTTGIVRPLSEEAWTATVTASFDVAKALGLADVVLSTGRTSERAHQERYRLPAEAYAMMGDFVEYSLKDARAHGFRKINLCAQWAKMVKIAMGTPQTHVRNGALEAEEAARFLRGIGVAMPEDRSFNTVREIYDHIRSETGDPVPVYRAVCAAARAYCEQVTGGIPVTAHLVSYEGSIVADSG